MDYFKPIERFLNSFILSHFKELDILNDLSTHFFSIFINFATINFYDDFKFYKNRIDMNGTKMKNLFGKRGM